MNHAAPLLGGVELGGTKCVMSIGASPDTIREQLSIPTGSTPQVTLNRIVEQLRLWQRDHGQIAALGIASFGPVDLNAQSSTYGYITSTPKPGWRFTDVAGPLRAAFDVPTRFDTDVNGAALAEGRWGAARGLADFAYVTVGTGVGVGVVATRNWCMGLRTPRWAMCGLLAGRRTMVPATANCIRTVSKGLHRAQRSRHWPECRRRI